MKQSSVFSGMVDGIGRQALLLFIFYGKNANRLFRFGQGKANMNIYVGNLPYSTTREDLEALFGEFGAVEAARVVMDRETGRSKGFGFVEMADEAGKAAIEKLNGSEIGGRKAVVNEARPREERPRTGGFRPRGERK